MARFLDIGAGLAMAGLLAAGGCSEPAAPSAASPPVATVFPAEAGPRHKAIIGIYDGKPGASPSCTATNFQSDGLIFPSGKMSCGPPGKVSGLSWTFAGRRGDQDLYTFTRNYPQDAPNSAMTSRQVAYAGERVVVFEDTHQTILIEGPKL